jgi:hypothetical protein
VCDRDSIELQQNANLTEQTITKNRDTSSCNARLGYSLSPDTLASCPNGGRKPPPDSVCEAWASNLNLPQPELYTCENMNLDTKKCVLRCDQSKSAALCETIAGAYCNVEPPSVPSRPNVCACA